MGKRDIQKLIHSTVHRVHEYPATIHFDDGDLEGIGARWHPKGTVIGEDDYAEAFLTQHRLVFLNDEIEGYTLVRAVQVTLYEDDCRSTVLHTFEITDVLDATLDTQPCYAKQLS